MKDEWEFPNINWKDKNRIYHIIQQFQTFMPNKKKNTKSLIQNISLLRL